MAVRKEWVASLKHRPLKQLRKWQRLVYLQIAFAYNTGNERASIDLQAMADSMTEAIMIKEFN